MPPQLRSRYVFTKIVIDDQGKSHLTEREPFRFREFSDNQFYTAKDGDTLFNVAGRFFRPLERAAGFWWAIADFQPDPIVDPTLRLELGRVLIIPSVSVLLNEILGEDQRRRT